MQIYVYIDIENQRETESVALTSTCKKYHPLKVNLLSWQAKKTEKGPKAATSHAQ